MATSLHLEDYITMHFPLEVKVAVSTAGDWTAALVYPGSSQAVQLRDEGPALAHGSSIDDAVHNLNQLVREWERKHGYA